MKGVGPVLKQNLYDGLMAAGACQAQRSMVVISRRPVDLGATLEQEGHRAQMPGPGRLHERGPSTLALVLELGTVL
jgi:hypothetical protein